MTNWFIIAAIVLIIELFIGSIYLMVISAALFGAGIAAFFTNNTSIALFTAAFLAGGGIWWTHIWLKKHKHTPNEDALKNDLDIGQTVHILRHLHTNIYEVSYRGTHWQAQALNQVSSNHTAQTAVITGKNSNVLLIHLH